MTVIFMSTEERNRRRAMRIADAINATEGVPVQTDAHSISLQWARGEISSAEMKQKLIAKHYRPAAANE